MHCKRRRLWPVACEAQVIITRNVRDFKGSPVMAMTPEAFIQEGLNAPPAQT
jgi:hypothetical protein